MYNSDEPEILHLDNIVFDSRCSEDHNMLTGPEGTHIMLKSALQISLRLFPFIKKVYLKDASCIENNGRSVHLSYYSLILHGQTWYERTVGAKLVKKKMNSVLDSFKSLLQTQPQVDVFPFYKSKNSSKYKSWHDYFAQMKVKHGIDAFYNIQGDVIKASKIKLFYSHWYIPRKAILEYTITIKDVKRKKHTHQYGGFNTYKRAQVLSLKDL
jgi:hypothetical protein